MRFNRVGVFCGLASTSTARITALPHGGDCKGVVGRPCREVYPKRYAISFMPSLTCFSSTRWSKLLERLLIPHHLWHKFPHNEARFSKGEFPALRPFPSITIRVDRYRVVRIPSENDCHKWSSDLDCSKVQIARLRGSV